MFAAESHFDSEFQCIPIVAMIKSYKNPHREIPAPRLAAYPWRLTPESMGEAVRGWERHGAKQLNLSPVHGNQQFRCWVGRILSDEWFGQFDYIYIYIQTEPQMSVPQLIRIGAHPRIVMSIPK